ncbi:MAG: GspH/FimT family pseudopilin [Steroidobacteraceae bacterium]
MSVPHLTTRPTSTASTDSRHAAPAARQAGVTLVELLVVMVIVVILMSIGVPSYRYVTTDNRMSTEANELLGDLQYARSEGVREGQTITVCAAPTGMSPSNPSCAASGTTTWQNGWVVFGDVNNDQTIDTGDPVLRIQSAFVGGDTFVSSGSGATNLGAFTFNRSGFLNQLGTSQVAVKLTGTGASTRCLNITLAGMLSVSSC